MLSRSDQFADALGGSTLAISKGGPLLLTPTDHLDAGVKAEITRVLGPATRTRPSTCSAASRRCPRLCSTRCKALGYNVQRISGAGPLRDLDRHRQSQVNAAAPGGSNQPERVLVATGDLSPDALSAGAAAESGASGPRVRAW